jgi:polar amino acid transport system substrate-binding protein
MNLRKLQRRLQRNVLIALVGGLLALFGFTIRSHAQAPTTPIPLVTLVPPTPLPSPVPPTATPESVNSALVRIKNRANDPSTNNSPTLIVGITYNIPRFAQMDDTGEIQGFEADIARAIAEDMGVKLIFKQVTRDNAISALLGGQIDLLMGQVILSRNPGAPIDFSDPIFMNKEVALVKNDTKANDVSDLSGATIGVVAKGRSEDAVKEWISEKHIQATPKAYPLLDSALKGLLNNEVSAIVGDRWELDQLAGHGAVTGVKLLNGAVRIEPYAIAMPRYDDNLRIIVNRTLQRLKSGKRLDPLYDRWFPTDLLPVSDRVTPYVWLDLDKDTRGIDNFPANIIKAPQPVIARIKAGQPLRVAGLGAPADSSGKQPILDVFNQALINEMAKRWGVQVQLVPDSYGKGEDLVASGAADIAVGLEPHWGTDDRVDFAGIYATHDYRLMVRYGSNNVNTFANFFATQHRMGVFADDPLAWPEVVAIAKGYSIAEGSMHKIVLSADSDAVTGLTTDNPTCDAVFGDSLRILSIIQANPKFVQLAGNDLKQNYPPFRQVSFAVPRNDADFRILVETTLQDMNNDGTYHNLWTTNLGVLGDPLNILYWPSAKPVD